MSRSEDISILITDPDFQAVLAQWNSFTNEQKSATCHQFNLSEAEVEQVRKLWLSLRFQKKEQDPASVNQALQETLWKMAGSKKQSPGTSAVRQLYRHFSKIAAILIVPLLMYALYLQFRPAAQMPDVAAQWITVNSQSGTVTRLSLPDGSAVVLNAGSSIRYPTYFTGNTREVSLQGEAFFEVVKNKEIPMNVSADKLNFKVYGTSFNLNTDDLDHEVKITLVEGSVSLSSPFRKFEGKDEFFISPGQTVSFSKESNVLKVQNADIYSQTAWKDGLLVFRNTNFETVIRQLSRRYNVDIEIKDQSLASIPMDATFRDENINEILRLLSLGTSFSYYYIPTRKMADGRFSKSKIYIEKLKSN